jgi:hypothetical protein
LDKRIPRNPKYENVQSTINTGLFGFFNTIEIHSFYLGDSLTNFLKRNEELRVCK